MSGGLLPKCIVFGNLEGSMRKDGVGRRNSGSIAYRAASGPLA